MNVRDDSSEERALAPTPEGESGEGIGRRGGLSRREFLRMAAVAGGAIGATGGLAGLLSACAAKEATSTTAGATTTTSTPGLTTTTNASLRTTTTASAPSTTTTTGIEVGRPVRIGYLAPATGPLAPFSSGAIWAQKHFEQALGDGILFGDKRMHPIEVVRADTQSDPSRAARATTDMIVDRKVDLVFAACTATTVNPSADVAESMGTPFISNWVEWHGFTAGREVPAGGFHWTYAYAFDDEAAALNCVGVFNMVESNRKVGLVLCDDVDGNSWAQLGSPMFKGAGFKVVETARYPPGAEDFTPQISQIQKEGCELMMAVMPTPDFTDFWTQARRQDYQPKVSFGQKALIFPESVTALGDSGINLCCSGAWTPRSKFIDSLTGRTCQQLAEEYEAFSGNQWNEAITVLTGFEWAADIFKRLTDVDDKEEYVRRIASTRLPCSLGTIDFTLPVIEMTRHPHPNVAVQPEAAAQWVKTAEGSKWPVDKVFIFTRSLGFIEVETTLQPPVY